MITTNSTNEKTSGVPFSQIATDARNKSILDIAESVGFHVVRRGSRYFTNSPYNDEGTPSCLLNVHNNTYYCFSSGKWGDTIQFVADVLCCHKRDAINFILSGNYLVNQRVEKIEKQKKEFVLSRYINKSDDEIMEINLYAWNRRIVNGYYPGVFYEGNKSNGFTRVPSVLFPLEDGFGNIVGGKFRRIDGKQPKFMLRGEPGFYILDNYDPADYIHMIYLCESETSANSLWRVMKQGNISGYVVSFGACTTIPEDIPIRLKDMNLERRIILDYDGNEDLYAHRLEKFKHLNAQPIKMILDKGEDINSLFDEKKEYLLRTLI